MSYAATLDDPEGTGLSSPDLSDDFDREAIPTTQSYYRSSGRPSLIPQYAPRPIHPEPFKTENFQYTDEGRGMPYQPPAPEPTSRAKWWGDVGRAAWAGATGMGSDLLGAADFAAQQMDANPTVRQYIQDKRKSVEDYTRSVIDAMSPEAKEAMQASLFKGGTTDDQGNKIPSVTGSNLTNYLVFNAAGMIPSVVMALLPAGIAGRAAVTAARLVGAGEKVAGGIRTGAALASNAGLFGAQNAGAVFNQIHDDIFKASDEEMKRGSEAYRQLRLPTDQGGQGMTEDQAKEQLTRTLAPSIYAAGGVGAAAGVGLGGKVGGTGGVIRRGLTGAAEGGIGMGAQGATDEAIRQQTQQTMGQRQGYDVGQIIAEAASQGVPGAVMGAAGHVLHGRKAIPEVRDEGKPNPDVPPDVAEALQQGIQNVPGGPGGQLLLTGPPGSTGEAIPTGGREPFTGMNPPGSVRPEDMGAQYAQGPFAQTNPSPSPGVPTAPPPVSPVDTAPPARPPDGGGGGGPPPPPPGGGGGGARPVPTVGPVAGQVRGPVPTAQPFQPSSTAPTRPTAPVIPERLKQMGLNELQQELVRKYGWSKAEFKGQNKTTLARYILDEEYKARVKAGAPLAEPATMAAPEVVAEPQSTGTPSPPSELLTPGGGEGTEPPPASTPTSTPVVGEAVSAERIAETQPRQPKGDIPPNIPVEVSPEGEARVVGAPPPETPAEEAKPSTPPPAPKATAPVEPTLPRPQTKRELMKQRMQKVVAEKRQRGETSGIMGEGEEPAAAPAAEEAPATPVVNKAERLQSLASAVRETVKVRGKNAEPIINKMVRDLNEQLGKTDVSDQSVLATLSNWSAGNEKIPGTDMTRQEAALGVARRMVSPEVRAEIDRRQAAAARKEDQFARTGSGGKQVTGHGEDLVGSEEGTMGPSKDLLEGPGTSELMSKQAKEEETSAGLTQNIEGGAKPTKAPAASVTDMGDRANNAVRRVLEGQDVHDIAKNYGHGENRRDGYRNLQDVLEREIAEGQNNDLALERMIAEQKLREDYRFGRGDKKELAPKIKEAMNLAKRHDPDRVSKLQRALDDLQGDQIRQALDDPKDAKANQWTPEYRDYRKWLDKAQQISRDYKHGLWRVDWANKEAPKAVSDIHRRVIEQMRDEAQARLDKARVDGEKHGITEGEMEKGFNDEYFVHRKRRYNIEPGHTSPHGIDPRSSRAYRTADDPRLGAGIDHLLRTSEEHGVPFSAGDLLKHVQSSPLLGTEARQLRTLAQQLLRLLPHHDDIPIMSIERADELGYAPSRMIDAVKSGRTMAYYHPGVEGRVPPHIVLGNVQGEHTRANRAVIALHEVLHALTDRYLVHLQTHDPNHNHVQALKALMAEVNRLYTRPGSENERKAVNYSTKDIHEFVSEMFTNPHVQAALSTMHATPEFRALMKQLGVSNQPRSMWGHFVDWVRKALNLGTPRSASEYSLLDYAMRHVQDVAEASAEFNRGKSLPVDPLLRSMAEPVMRHFDEGNARSTRDMAGRVYDHIDPRGRGSKFRQLLLQGMPTDFIASKYKSILPSIERWRRANELIGYTGKKFSDTHSDFVTKWNGDYNSLRPRDRNALGQLMTDATIGEARLGRGFTDNSHLTTDEQKTQLRELQGRFNALSPEAKGLYESARDKYAAWYKDQRDAQLRGLSEALDGASPEQRQKFIDSVKTPAGFEKFLANPDNSEIAKALGERWGAQRQIARGIGEVARRGYVQGDYFPLRRFGDYVVTYGDRNDPANYGVERFEKRSEADRRYAELAKQNTPGLRQVTLRAESDIRTVAPNSGLVDEITNAMERRGAGADTIRQTRDLINTILSQHATQSEGARARLRRRGVRGASIDQGRVMSHDFLSNEVRSGYLEHGMERARALEAMRDEARRLETEGQPGQAVEAQQVLREIEQRMLPVEDHNSRAQRIGAKLNAFSYAMNLKSISHLLTGTIESHTNSIALLGGRHGVVRSSAALTRALAQLSPGVARGAANTIRAVGGELKAKDWNYSDYLRDRLTKGLSAEDKQGVHALFKALEEAGLIDHTAIQDIRKQANPSGVVGSGVGKLWDRYNNFSAAGQHAVDAVNKSAIAKAAYDLELRKTGDRGKAIEYAIETARRVSPNYTTANKARIASSRGMFGVLGSPLFQFKNYGLHMYSLIGALARESVSGPGAWEARKSLALLLASHAAMAGTLTLIADPLRYVMGAYDYATNAKRPHAYEADLRAAITDTFGPQLGELISRGVPHALGIDIHRRVGLANLLEIPELDTFDKAGLEKVLLGLATGASGEALTNLFDGVAKLRQGDWKGGLAALPRDVKNVMQAVQLGDKGVTDSHGKTILPPSKITLGDQIRLGLGFQPSQVSEFREARNAALGAEEEAKDEHDRLTTRWLNATGSGKADTMAEIRQYNATPQGRAFPITMQNLLRNAQNRMKNTPYGLSVSKRSARFVERAGAFANVQ